ncbi:Wdr27 [Columba livia]|nr:Wdr27 [Columba livia]
MANDGDYCSSGGSCNPDVVCEKYVFKSKQSESLVQLACSHHHCAFPLNRNELCIWNTATAQNLTAPEFYISLNLNNNKIVAGLTPQGIVIGTLLGMVLHVRFSPDDQQVAVCAGNQIYMLNAKVWDYSTGQLRYQSGVLTAFPLLSLLVDEENKQIITGCAEGQLWIFSLINGHNYRCVAHVNLKKEQERFCNKVWKSGKEIGEGRNNSKLCKTNNMRPGGSVETSLPILLIEHCDFLVCFHNEENISFSLNASYFWIGSSTGLLIVNLANFEIEGFLSYKGVKSMVKDQPLFFHNKIKSSGYTVAPRMTMFSPNINLKKNEVSKWKTTCKRKNKEYPLESYPPIKYEKEISVTCKPTPICCIQYAGDGEKLACGLADKTVVIFSSNLTDTHNVFSGHDGAVNSVGWSHDKKFLVSASEDRTLRVWSVCNNESALILGKEKFQKTVRFAQFYFIDTFILLCCGAEFHLLRFHPDTTKDDLKRTQQPEAYNLFMTTAAGDGIKLWDLRTLRCERRFEGHSSRCYPCGIAVSPCGRFIASGSDDKYAYIYEMRSSTFSHKLGGHTESVINVAFSPSSPQRNLKPAVSFPDLPFQEIKFKG